MRYLACLAFVAAAWAQGTTPKAKADDYEVHTRAKRIELGAEYMVTSVAGPNGMYVVPDHLVVEVALFPPKGEAVGISAGNFELRVDGRTLHPVSAEAVVAAIQRAEWKAPRGVQATAGMGNDSVIIGGAPTRRTPAPPRAPEPENRSGLPPPEPVKLTELVVSTGLPEGDFKGPVSGFLYFPFTGKASKIRTVALQYGDSTLKLK